MPGLSRQSRRKKELGAADLTIHPAPDIPRYEGRTTTDQAVSPVWWGDEELELQIATREERAESNRQLVDFAVCLQARHRDTDEDWVDIARVDCSNGFVHVDDQTAAHDTSRVPSECRTDLDAAYQWGLAYIWDVDKRMAE